MGGPGIPAPPMAGPPEPTHRTRTLAVAVLAGTVVLLVLLIAIPLVVPHESLPEPIIVFVSIFILIAALIAGIAVAYLLLARSPAPPAPSFATNPSRKPPYAEAIAQPPAPPPTPQAAPAPASPADPAFQDLAIRLLDGDERRLLKVIVEAKGDILQRDLVRITAFSEAKVSRLLDRLEQRGLVRRERRGMANRVRLTLNEA